MPVASVIRVVSGEDDRTTKLGVEPSVRKSPDALALAGIVTEMLLAAEWSLPSVAFHGASRPAPTLSDTVGDVLVGRRLHRQLRRIGGARALDHRQVLPREGDREGVVVLDNRRWTGADASCPAFGRCRAGWLTLILPSGSRTPSLMMVTSRWVL